MKKIIERIESVVANAKSFGHAVINIAGDLGIHVPYNENNAISIIDTFYCDEAAGCWQFRLNMAIAMVRYFDTLNRDVDKVPYFKAMYAKFCDRGELTSADMQTYHTLMFMLHPQPLRIDDWQQLGTQCPQCPMKKKV